MRKHSMPILMILICNNFRKDGEHVINNIAKFIVKQSKCSAHENYAYSFLMCQVHIKTPLLWYTLQRILIIPRFLSFLASSLYFVS